MLHEVIGLNPSFVSILLLLVYKTKFSFKMLYVKFCDCLKFTQCIISVSKITVRTNKKIKKTDLIKNISLQMTIDNSRKINKTIN